ncbi:hypothetical protein [Chitinophaga solisilvae]|uniref:Uncharacterized protein n=1 Tax=Chitinophaga solisilvae TaxID=1233460 RepID=A0A433WHZ3_9BACT|nr:hypothetical protein [Chitinophaga solisilvae]NSL86396.1 hypothetical protein [Chitinophaga solisilvae]
MKKVKLEKKSSLSLYRLPIASLNKVPGGRNLNQDTVPATETGTWTEHITRIALCPVPTQIENCF